MEYLFSGVSGVLHGWGQLRAKDMVWPSFNRNFVNYPCFIKKWWAYKQTYHRMTEDNLVAKILRRSA
jgi:hypothetical protein